MVHLPRAWLSLPFSWWSVWSPWQWDGNLSKRPEKICLLLEVENIAKDYIAGANGNKIKSNHQESNNKHKSKEDLSSNHEPDEQESNNKHQTNMVNSGDLPDLCQETHQWDHHCQHSILSHSAFSTIEKIKLKFRFKEVTRWAVHHHQLCQQKAQRWLHPLQLQHPEGTVLLDKFDDGADDDVLANYDDHDDGMAYSFDRQF